MPDSILEVWYVEDAESVAELIKNDKPKHHLADIVSSIKAGIADVEAFDSFLRQSSPEDLAVLLSVSGSNRALRRRVAEELAERAVSAFELGLDKKTFIEETLAKIDPELTERAIDLDDLERSLSTLLEWTETNYRTTATPGFRQDVLGKISGRKQLLQELEQMRELGFIDQDHFMVLESILYSLPERVLRDIRLTGRPTPKGQYQGFGATPAALAHHRVGDALDPGDRSVTAIEFFELQDELGSLKRQEPTWAVGQNIKGLSDTL